jgi:5-deoxy-glucuronate isomerase
MPDFALQITPEEAGWTFCGLRVARGDTAFDTGDDELIVLPLEGGAEVTVEGESFTVQGREGVWDGPTDFVYVPRDSHVEIAASGRVALPSSRAWNRREPRHVAEVAVELRGAGRMSRQIHNFCGPDTDFADRLIAVEVITPGGNWSSYPPHKHDEDIPGQETALEEIYYFEVADGGFAYQRAYGPGVDILEEVRSGDHVLLPSGYHGPSMAAPGYDLYYLNVMAGPGEREWRFTDDPAHAWIRESWEGQDVDPRLPLIARPEAEHQSQTSGPDDPRRYLS